VKKKRPLLRVKVAVPDETNSNNISKGSKTIHISGSSFWQAVEKQPSAAL